MAIPMLYQSTYQWDCSGCDTKCLAIRRNEKLPLTSVACPSCGLRIMVSPTIRREQQRQLVAASEIA